MRRTLELGFAEGREREAAASLKLVRAVISSGFQKAPWLQGTACPGSREMRMWLQYSKRGW